MIEDDDKMMPKIALTFGLRGLQSLAGNPVAEIFHLWHQAYAFSFFQPHASSL